MGFHIEIGTHYAGTFVVWMLLMSIRMNALVFLKRDHDAIKRLFEALASRQVDSGHIFGEIALAVESHSHIEESIFYPVIEEQKNQELIAIVDASLKDHQEIKSLAKGLRRPTGGDSVLETGVTELRRKIVCHLAEEEIQLFPRVSHAMGTVELDRLGEELEMAKQTYVAATANKPEIGQLRSTGQSTATS